MTTTADSQKKLNWINAAKGFALIGILLNHFVELFGPGPWFTNPDYNWPDLELRLQNIYPGFVRFIGWLGDSGPGVFIVVSGLTLTLSSLLKNRRSIAWNSFISRRLLRIFPLYLTVHFIILGGMVLLPGMVYQLEKAPLLLSLLGLRFTDNLFFYVNPSWWFIWLIIQLYVLFPFLYKWLVSFKPVRFIILALSITVVFRLMGLWGFTYNQNLYYWMTGLFFGTRLAEFAAGMVLGYLIHESAQGKFKIPKTVVISSGSVLLYLIGFGLQLFYYTTVLSNFFVSIGLTGIFYGAYKTIEKLRFKPIEKVIVWIGSFSFGIYLIHQAPMRWAAKYLSGTVEIVAIMVVIIVSIVAGAFLEKNLDRILHQAKSLFKPLNPLISQKINLLFVSIIVLISVIDPFFPSGRMHASFEIILALIFIWILADFRATIKPCHKLVSLALMTTIFLYSVFSPEQLGPLTAMISLLVFAIMMLLQKWLKNPLVNLLAALSMTLILAGITEVILQKEAPLELSKWGEFDALQKDSTRVYSLKPYGNFQLRYNNYDYILKTNSQGLTSPEIDPVRSDSGEYRILILGDAFSMPEGLPYADSYPSLLQQKLKQTFPDKNIRIINGGVTGYGPNEELAQFSELCPLYKPNLVIYQFFVNEFTEIDLSPEQRLKSIGLISDKLTCRKWLAGNLQITAYADRLIEDLKEKVTGVPPKWKMTKSLLKYYETNRQDIYDPETLEKLKTTLLKMKKIGEENEVTLLLMYVPAQIEVSKIKYISYFPKNVNLNVETNYNTQLPLNQTINICNETGIELINLKPFLKNYANQPVYFPDSWHWNQNGHKAVAEELHKLLENKILEKK